MANNPTMYQRLRAFFNKAIKGPNTDDLLKAIAVGDQFNADNVLAMKDNLLIATAEGRFLEKLMAGIGVTKPAGTGIDDDSFRELGIATTYDKMVGNIFLEVLELFYGEDAVKANLIATAAETYPLQDGMDLFILQDGNPVPLHIIFNAEDFQNIAQASAIEISSIIAREALVAGYTVYASPNLDSTTNLNHLQILSGTRGPRSAITIIGGSAQNVFKFPQLRLTTQMAGTQFAVSIDGGFIRYTWTSGPDPSLQAVQTGDYVNISANSFPSVQAGSFSITKVSPGTVGSAYFEIVNPLVETPGTFTLASANDLLFFFPKKNTINDLARIATLYEVNPYEMVLLLPATTQIVKRSLIGGWHIHPTSTDKSFLGSYSYDPKQNFSITKTSAPADQTLAAGQIYKILSLNGSSAAFPDQIGYLVFDYGFANQEGPVRYLGRPSDGTLLLDASYTFKKTHINPDVMLVKLGTTPIGVLGANYPTYLTDTIIGRKAVESISESLVAAGISLQIIVGYPAGPGLQNVQAVYS